MVENAFRSSPSMMALAHPCYDPENHAWPAIIDEAYDSMRGAIAATLVPFAVASMATLNPPRAWEAYVSAHPLEAGVVVGHLQSTSVAPFQALYQLVNRRVVTGYEAVRAGTAQSLGITVQCPKCSERFAPWEQISDAAEI
jgi:hypothetical protein